MEEELEELSEEEKEKRKKKKQREQLLRQMAKTGIGIVKSVGKVCAVPISIVFKTFEDDKGILAFLENSGIKKKTNHQKEIAENTAAIAKALEKAK